MQNGENAANGEQPNQQSNNDVIEQPIEGPSSQSNDLLQSIALPKNALLPPGWLILPLKKPEQQEANGNGGGGVDYKVNISSYHQADLKINKEKPSTREIITYGIPKEEPI